MTHGTQPDHGWAWVVVFASFGVHTITCGLAYCTGVIHTALLEKLDEPVYLVSLAGSISSSLLSLLGPLSSYLMNQFNCRVATILGGVLVSSGLFAAAFVDSLGLIIVFYGIVAGLGTGLAYSAGVVVVGFGFEKRRNLASGIAVAGAGVGTLALSPLITAVNNAYGYSGLFIILSGIGLQICLFGALLRPSRLENERKELSSRKKTENNLSFMSNLFLCIKIFRNASFVCFCISIFSWNIGVYIVFLHLPSYVMTLNTSQYEASFLLSITGVVSCVSRVVTGLVTSSQRVSELVVYSISFGILGISTSIFPNFSTSYAAQLIYSVILGLFFGNCYAVMAAINVKIVGIENLATAYGVEMFFCGLGTLIGPPLAGFIIDSGGTYGTAFIIAGATIAMGGLLGILTFCLNRRTHHDIMTINVIYDGKISTDSKEIVTKL